MVLAAVLPIANATAQISPDKKVSAVGNWVISTGVYSTGCVAHLNTSGGLNDGREVSLSGDALGNLILLITILPSEFKSALDGSEEHVSGIEVVLNNGRWSNIEPYGYRGTPGLVLTVDDMLLVGLVQSRKIRITELGKERVAIAIQNTGAALDLLFDCLRQR